MSGSREKLRAVFLAFVMITSVLAAGVAFSGSAAAQQSTSTIQVSDLNNGADTAQSVGLSAAAPGGSNGPTVNAQELDSSRTTSAPTGLQSTLTAQTTGDGTFANGDTETFTIDENGDGSASTTVTVEATGAGTAQIFIGSKSGNSLDNNEVTSNDDEEIVFGDGSSASKDIKIGEHTYNVKVADTGSNDVEVTSTTFHTGSFQVDGDGDQQVDDTVNFALVDDNGDGVYENLELSIGDASFSGDIQITDSSGSGSPTQQTLGNADFNIRYDSGTQASNVGDASVDVTATALKYEATGQATGDNALDIAVFDTDSNGVYDQVAISDDGEDFDAGSTSDGTVDLTGSSNSEIFSPSTNNVLTFVGSSSETKFNVRSSETFQDPINNNIELELGFQFTHEESDIGAFVDTSNNVRLDLNQDDDFQDDNEREYARGEYIDASDSPGSLGSAPASQLNEIYFVEDATSSTLTLEPVPRAGFTFDLTILDTDDTSDINIDDIGVDALAPDDSSPYGAGQITVNLGSDNKATINGLEFRFASDPTAGESAGSFDDQSEYVGIASSLSSPPVSGDTDLADIEIRPSDFETVSIDSNVDSLTYDTAQDVTVTVTDDGSALQGTQVSLIVDDGSTTSAINTGFTNSDGEVSFSDVTPTAAGTLEIKATADRGGTPGNSGSADAINDLDTQTDVPIDPIALQLSTSSNLLKDFDSTPTFNIEFTNGTTFEKINNDDGTEGAQVSISGSVLQTSDSNDAGTNYQEDSFVIYATDQASSTTINGGNQVIRDDADSASNPNEKGQVTGVSGSSFTPDQTGTLEVRAEYQEDGNNNGPAEYNVTQDFEVTEADNLNINAQGTLTADDSTDNLDVAVQGIDSNGPDGGSGNSLDTVEISLSGPGIDLATGTSAELSGGGSDLGDASRQSSNTFRFQPNANENGTVTVTVDAVDDNGDEFSKTANVSVTGDRIQNLTPTGTITSGQVAQISLTAVDGNNDPLFNRQVIISQDGAGSSSNAIFRGDVNNDDSTETVNKILIDGSQGTIAFDTDDDATGPQFDATNGQYEVQNSYSPAGGVYETPELTANTAGDQIDIEVYEPNNDNLRAFRTDFLTTQGNQTFEVNADVDTFVAGFEEQVNITVTNTTSGERVNSSTLDRLADQDGDGTIDNLLVEQQGNNVIDRGGLTTVDANDSINGVDTIRGTVDADEDGSAAVNITTRTNSRQKFGEAAISVEAPQVQTNITNAQLTENIQNDVNIEVVDPRDGSILDVEAVGGTNNPALRLTAFNTSFEYKDADASDNFDVDGNSNGNSVTPTAFDAANVNNGQTNATVMAYPDGDSGPQRLEFEVSFDGRSDFFGSDNVTVGAQQVTADPSNVILGSQSTIEVIAEDANGQAIPQQGISLSGAASTSGSTDDSGFVAFTVNPGASGTINIDVDSDGLEGADPGTVSPPGSTTEETVNVTTEQSEFDVTVDPQTVTANTTTTVTVTATNNASGDAVEGASVDLSGAGVNESAQTDANGEAAIDVTASETGTIEVTVNDAGFNSATATITVEEEPEPGAVQIDNVNLDPNSVTANTTNDHDLTFDALNVSADNSTDSFTVEIPSAATLESANDVTVTTENVSAQNLAVDGNNITFDVNPDSESVDVDLSVETNVTVSAPSVSQETTADLTINATDSDGSSDSASATLTITVEEAAPEPADFTVSNVTPDGVNVTAGDNITVSADIENVGGQQATQSVEFRIVAADGNTSIDNASATATQNVTLDAGANDTVTFENVSTDGLAAGDFTHGVFSANDSATATITLQDQGLVARFDENDNGEIELTEVQTAIRAFSDGDLTLSEIQTLIRAFSGE